MFYTEKTEKFVMRPNDIEDVVHKAPTEWGISASQLPFSGPLPAIISATAKP